MRIFLENFRELEHRLYRLDKMIDNVLMEDDLAVTERTAIVREIGRARDRMLRQSGLTAKDFSSLFEKP